MPQEPVEEGQIGRRIGQRDAREPRLTLQCAKDDLGEGRLDVPAAEPPPPPRPPATAPAEGDAERAGGIGGRAANQLLAPPPPPRVDVVGADHCAWHRAPIRAQHTPPNREAPAPAQPPEPVIRSDSQRREGNLGLPAKTPQRHVDRQRLQSEQLLVGGVGRTHGNGQASRVVGDVERNLALTFLVEGNLFGCHRLSAGCNHDLQWVFGIEFGDARRIQGNSETRHGTSR